MIVGGVTGAATVITLLAVGLIWFCRRKRAENVDSESHPAKVMAEANTTAMPATTPHHRPQPPGSSMLDNPTSQDTGEDLPPVYAVLPAAQAQIPVANSFIGTPSNVVEAVGQPNVHNDPLSQFCAENRDLITSTLEEKLRAARYFPRDDPDEIPADYWRNTYGVDFFDLKRLKEAYYRSSGTADPTLTPTGKAAYTPRKGSAS